MRSAPGTLAFPKQQFQPTPAVPGSQSFTKLNSPTLMLRWIITFLVVALIAGVFGFTGVAGAATDIARILFYVFLVLLLVAIVASLFRGSPPAP
jgi:uncharacterized membrane protein YtjA (UPF0391 family)